MGEAVLKHVAKQRGIELEVDSAGTAAYHTGEDPDDRYVDPISRAAMLSPVLIASCLQSGRDVPQGTTPCASVIV